MSEALVMKIVMRKSLTFIFLSILAVWFIFAWGVHPADHLFGLPEVQQKHETTANSYQIKLNFITADHPKTSESLSLQSPNESETQNDYVGAVRHVLINSIGRSGSSMFGEIISSFSAKPFYVFEPLWAVQLGKFIDPNLTLNVLKDSFNCEFNKSLTSPYFLQWPHSDRTFKLQPNLTAKSFIYYQETLSERRRKALQRYCPKVNFKIIKVIRLSLLSVEKQVIILEQLLAEFKDLVIFFLVRDPRAALYSRMKKVFWNTTDSQTYCVEERRIYSAGRELINRGWGKQVRILKYEDIALNPVACIKSIATFMGMDFLPRTQEWIEVNMKGGEPASSKELKDPYATVHRNASSLVRQWEDSQIQLQDFCKSVIHELGYSE